MKILFLSHQADFIYGGEICTLELMHKLKKKHETIFCSPLGPYYERAKKITETHLISSIEFRRNFFVLPKFCMAWVKTRKELKELIAENQIDIIHATNLKSLVYAWNLLAKTNLKVIWHHHDIMPRKFSNHYWLNFLAIGCDKVLVPSKATKQALLESGIENEKVHIVHNGIDISSWPLRTKVNNNKKLKIVLLGEISRRKGTDIVAPLISQLVKKIPNKFQFTIIGDALSEPDFAKEVRKANKIWCDAGYVEFLGRREDIKDLLYQQDLMIVPSQQDPFPTVIIEAAFSSLPVLASPVGGIPEMLIEGKTGYLCSDIDQYAHRIIELEAKREKLISMSESARKVGKEEFSSLKMAAKVSEIYHEIVPFENSGKG